jgi:hypothetical protein
MPAECGARALKGTIEELFGKGGLERRNPIPAGRYWIDVIGTENIKAFFSLMNEAQKLGVVQIENSEFQGTTFDLDTILQKIAGGGDPQAWVLFRVTGVGTISLDNTRFGYPTIATTNIEHKDDTSQAPPTPSGLSAVPMWLWLGGGLVALVAVASIISDVSKFVPKGSS